MTPDDLRRKLRLAMGERRVEEPCRACHGKGYIDRVVQAEVTQSQVAEAIGTTRTGVSTFLSGRQTFGMDVTLRLIDWIEQRASEPTQPEEERR
jgi:transcriptional regulator with XRE-family HTH domain